jgi:Uma2 family endonuclease
MGTMVAPVVPGRWPDRIDGEWTVEDLETLPDDGMRYEIIDGILQVSPSPVTAHQRAVLRLAVAFTAACPPGFEVFVAPLDWQPDRRTSLEPDVLVVPKDAIGPKNISGTPALVVEVLSPSTARIDRMLKFSRYAEGGIGQYWIVDPAVPSIQTYSLRGETYELIAEGVDAEQVSGVAPMMVTVSPASLIAD